MNIDKSSQKVTKDPKRVETGCKGRKNFMNKLKEDTLNYAKKGCRDATNASNETTSATNNVSNETTSATNTATKNIQAGCYGYEYYSAYRWNLWRGICERLCSLHKMDQRVIKQKFYNPYRVIKLHSEGTWELLLFNG